jgi:hypothetical protein
MREVVQTVWRARRTYQSGGWDGNLIQWCRTTGAGLAEAFQQRVLIDASSRRSSYGRPSRVARKSRAQRVGRRPVSRVLSRTIIPLGPVSPQASSSLPGSHGRIPLETQPVTAVFRLPYLALLQVGFTVPPMLPPARCALTAPFHPYRRRGFPLRLGGLLSVALSVGSRPPGVTWHLIRRSPDFPPPSCEGSDCPADSPRAPYGASSVLASFIAKA